MSWLDRYREQAEAWRREAHAWATHGKEGHAKRCLEIAEVYDELAKEEEERPLSFSREETIAAICIEVSPGEFHPWDGMCGTCRGAGGDCENCNGKGFKLSDG